MALSTSDNIAIFDTTDGQQTVFRAPTMEVFFVVLPDGTSTSNLQLYGDDGGAIGAAGFSPTDAELIAEEATYLTALATVIAAHEKAVKTKLLAIGYNSGATITYT